MFAQLIHSPPGLTRDHRKHHFGARKIPGTINAHIRLVFALQKKQHAAIALQANPLDVLTYTEGYTEVTRMMLIRT